jgi:hypothetical protein
MRRASTIFKKNIAQALCFISYFSHFILYKLLSLKTTLFSLLFILQNKLKKEDAFTRLNVAKIKSEWRDILRRIKCKQLHEDLKAIKSECDESIRRKNAVIKKLLCDLDESEEIYSTMLHSHMNIVEKLIGRQILA